jgi:hypothetical protein
VCRPAGYGFRSHFFATEEQEKHGQSDCLVSDLSIFLSSVFLLWQKWFLDFFLAFHVSMAKKQGFQTPVGQTPVLFPSQKDKNGAPRPQWRLYTGCTVTDGSQTILGFPV